MPQQAPVSLKTKLKTVYNRGFSTGFYLGIPDAWSKNYGSVATTKKVYLGKVLNYYNKPQVAEIKLESASLKLNDSLMVQGNKTGVIEQPVTSIQIHNRPQQKAPKGSIIGIKISKVRKNDKVYLINSRK